MSLNRSNFPADFVFGTASSAYQYEGAAKEGGRGPSIWDTFTTYPGKIRDGSNADRAVDSYHRYKEDVGIMKEIGLDAYRLSISWPRILPHGKLSGGVNKEGINYYNDLINELLQKGIKPFVTIFHWDLPQALEDAYGGFLSPEIVEDYKDYADLCFKEFGDRVKHWMTFNEPWMFSNFGYSLGIFPPGRCSSTLQKDSLGGDSSVEPYIVSHHHLLAHAAASQLYKQKYQAFQKGKIGIALVTHWMIPFSEARENQEAARRAMDFMFGWFMDPLTTGDYPPTMRALVGNRLPNFTEEQSEMLKGSIDFLGLNYYTAKYVEHAPKSNDVNPSYNTDSQIRLMAEKDGIPIGPKGASDWLFSYPRGIYDTLLYIKKNYNDPVIYITENGIDEVNDATLSLEEALEDKKRVDYFYGHLSFLLQAIKDGANVKGYFAWSLLDNFEWGLGYTARFGINYVDYNDGLKRYPKLSAKWFKYFLKQESFEKIPEAFSQMVQGFPQAGKSVVVSHNG